MRGTAVLLRAGTGQLNGGMASAVSRETAMTGGVADRRLSEYTTVADTNSVPFGYPDYPRLLTAEHAEIAES
jgi:hypothetical protein